MIIIGTIAICAGAVMAIIGAIEEETELALSGLGLFVVGAIINMSA